MTMDDGGSQLSVAHLEPSLTKSNDGDENSGCINADRPMVFNKTTSRVRAARSAGSPSPEFENPNDAPNSDGPVFNESNDHLSRKDKTTLNSVISVGSTMHENTVVDTTTPSTNNPNDLNDPNDPDDPNDPNDPDDLNNPADDILPTSPRPDPNPHSFPLNEPFPLQATRYDDDHQAHGGTKDPGQWCHAHIWEHLWRKQTKTQRDNYRKKHKHTQVVLESDTVANDTTLPGECPLFSIPDTFVVPPTPWSYGDANRPTWYFSSSTKKGTPILKKKRRRHDLLGFAPREVYDSFSKLQKTKTPSTTKKSSSSSAKVSSVALAQTSGVVAVLSWYDPVVGQVRETHLDRMGLFRWIDRYLGSVDEDSHNGGYASPTSHTSNATSSSSTTATKPLPGYAPEQHRRKVSRWMVLQRFVPPATPQAETIRVRWTPHATTMHRCLNRHALHDDALDGGGVDLSTRMATSLWDCSDADTQAVSIHPLGGGVSDGSLLYGDGLRSKTINNDNRVASQCLNVRHQLCCVGGIGVCRRVLCTKKSTFIVVAWPDLFFLSLRAPS